MVSRRDQNADAQRKKHDFHDAGQCLNSRALCPQCAVGHRDESADHRLLGPQRRRHEPVPVARPAHLRVGSLRRLGQTVGHQGQHVPADLHRPRVGHQRHLCECARGARGLVTKLRVVKSVSLFVLFIFNLGSQTV